MNYRDFKSIEPFLIKSTIQRNFVSNETDMELESAYFPVGAVLSVVAMMEDGQGIETCTIGRENAFGLANALGSPCTVEQAICQIPGDCYHLPISRLRRAASESRTLTELLIRHIQASQAQISQAAACNALHTVEARLCRYLLMSQDRAAQDILPLTQEFLGFMLGVQRTTVTAAAHHLQAAEVIRCRRGHIEILDRAQLEAGACECYAAAIARHARFFEDYPGREDRGIAGHRFGLGGALVAT